MDRAQGQLLDTVGHLLAAALVGCRPTPESHFGAPMAPHSLDPAYQEGITLLAVIRIGAIQVPFFSKKGLAEDDEKDSNVGQTAYYPYTHVLIDSELGPQVRAMTMMHELFHVMSDCGGFSLTERQVEGMEHAFGQLVQDNPDVMGCVFEALKRRDVPQPVIDCLEKATTEEQTKAMAALDDRGLNLN